MVTVLRVDEVVVVALTDAIVDELDDVEEVVEVIEVDEVVSDEKGELLVVDGTEELDEDVLEAAAEFEEEVLEGADESDEELTKLLVLTTDETVELEEIELLVLVLEVPHEEVHADAVPTSITSCHPPLDQNVRIEAEDPVLVGVNVIVIVVLPAAGIVAPLAGNPVAVNALPTTTGFVVVVTLIYGEL